MPAIGTGFGNVPYREVARQMATAYDTFVHPPSHLDRDAVIERHRRVSNDGDRKVIN